VFAVIASAATGFAFAASAGGILVTTLLTISIGAVLATALLVRVEIRADPTELAVRGRVGRHRAFLWPDVEEIALEVYETGVRWRGTSERPTVAQVVILSGGHWVALPGARSVNWSADKLHDPLGGAHAKAVLLVRYRHAVAQRRLDSERRPT
jgi:hypothetical protein